MNRLFRRHAVASSPLAYAFVVAVAAAGCAVDGDGLPAESDLGLVAPLSVRIDSVSTGHAYTTVTAAQGINYYTDRTFKIGSLSSRLVGGVLIKTANDDKNVSRAKHLRFTPSLPSTVYVAMDKRMTTRPGWLDSTWRSTSETFTSTGDASASPFKVFAKDFQAVQVILGGNKNSPGAGMVSNYVVVVVAATGTGTGGAGGGGGSAGAGGQGTGGAGTGGAATGGAATGGAATGGAATGGAATGGAATGGAATGGAATGGAATGGAATGGAATGGAATGGAATGGAATGGAATGGAATGGAATGGAATGGAATGGAGTGGAATGGTGGAVAASLYVIAHPDDDVLFINPAVETDIQSGRPTTTVYVTSGDASDGPFPSREPRIMSAYAAMAGVADTWTCTTRTFAGKGVKSCVLTARPTVNSLFLRVLDGRVMDLRSGARVATADGATSYNESELQATLLAIVADLQPTRVGTLDGSMLDNGEVEHTDHVAAAIFAFDAARTDGAARQLLMYRGYTTYYDPAPPAHEPQNLTTAQYNEKVRIVTVYLEGQAPTDYDNWIRRTYSYDSTAVGPTALHHASQCLEAAGTTAGSAVRAVTCNAVSTGQTWTAGANSRVVGAGGLCLGTNGSAAELQACNNSAGQRWTLMTNGQLRGTRVSCLAASGATVSVADCEGTTNSSNKFVPLATQTWTAGP